MNTQPDALRLADELEMWTMGEPAAVELRRLHAENVELREAIKRAVQVVRIEQAQPPAWWAAVENILNEYGLQAIDFVADFKAAQHGTLPKAEQAQPVAKVQLLTTGGNAGLATRIVEIDDPLRDRLRPGQMLYTAPPQRQPLTDEEIEYLYFDKLNCDFKAFARAIEVRSGIKG